MTAPNLGTSCTAMRSPRSLRTGYPSRENGGTAAEHRMFTESCLLDDAVHLSKEPAINRSRCRSEFALAGVPGCTFSYIQGGTRLLAHSRAAPRSSMRRRSERSPPRPICVFRASSLVIVSQQMCTMLAQTRVPRYGLNSVHRNPAVPGHPNSSQQSRPAR